MASNSTILQLADQQQKIFITLITNLYDTLLAGLNETHNRVINLESIHAWYHSNLDQIQNLKTEITEIQKRYDSHIQNILNQITEQKTRVKEILVNALNQLESTVNTQDIKKYLDDLINAIDNLVDNISGKVLLISIFSELGLSSLIATIIAISRGAFAFSIVTLATGLLASSIVSEVSFRTKLSELDEKLAATISNVKGQKYERIQKINEHFNNFKDKLHHRFTNEQNSKINIVWYDKNIQNNENQRSYEVNQS